MLMTLSIIFMEKYQFVLASNSPYRKMLLEKMRLSFVTKAHQVNESEYRDGDPQCLAEQLAYEKAQSIMHMYPQSIIIGSDQMAYVEEDNRLLTKPRTMDNAIEQLLYLSGKTVIFYTGIAILGSYHNISQKTCDTFSVTYKVLSKDTIIEYLNIEKPLNCLGCFKSEGLGIALLDNLTGRDPNALIGLPILSLIDLLKKENIDFFDCIEK